MSTCEFHLNKKEKIRWPTINAQSGMVPYKTQDKFIKLLFIYIYISYRLKYDIDIIHFL